jgi:hypothetical protein
MRREQNIGKHGQNIAASVLSGRCGIEMVEQIATPIKLIPASTTRKDIFRVVWGEPVSGDHRGIIGNGISVLAETKTILDHNLRWGNLREHQPARLDEHVSHGGISLLVWVYSDDAYVMRWPVEGFGPGKSISHERAQELNAETITYLDVMRVFQKPMVDVDDNPFHDVGCIICGKIEQHWVDVFICEQCFTSGRAAIEFEMLKREKEEL